MSASSLQYLLRTLATNLVAPFHASEAALVTPFHAFEISFAMCRWWMCQRRRRPPPHFSEARDRTDDSVKSSRSVSNLTSSTRRSALGWTPIGLGAGKLYTMRLVQARSSGPSIAIRSRVDKSGKHFGWVHPSSSLSSWRRSRTASASKSSKLCKTTSYRK